MNEYVIYTTEGYTQNPAGDEVNNCQVLGVGCAGENEADAITGLENELGISELGFDPSEAKAVQLVTDEQRAAIRDIVAHVRGDYPLTDTELVHTLDALAAMVGMLSGE